VVRLRDYRPADFLRLCDIDRRCFQAGIAYSQQEMAALVDWPASVILVAETPGGRIAGFVLAHRRRLGRAHLITLDVLPSWRRRGLGRRLLLACERRLRAAGAGTLWLETASSNTNAQSLYVSLGYTRVRRLPRYYPNGEDAWLMKKDLGSRIE
jgi:ribosomal-protein-alanine N-acetyltransferase